MQSLSRNTFTSNLVSNASMTTFPESSLAQFTTLLPEAMQLQGTWEVAVVEISWSNLIKNVTEGKFTDQKVDTLTTEASSRKRHPHRGYTPALVTMSDPPKRTHSIVQENKFKTKNHILYHVGAIQRLIACWTRSFAKFLAKLTTQLYPWNGIFVRFLKFRM